MLYILKLKLHRNFMNVITHKQLASNIYIYVCMCVCVCARARARMSRNRSTCLAFVNAIMNVGIPVNAKISWMPEELSASHCAPYNYFARPVTNAVLPFAGVRRSYFSRQARQCSRIRSTVIAHCFTLSDSFWEIRVMPHSCKLASFTFCCTDHSKLS